jgi:hypothetical protein
MTFNLVIFGIVVLWLSVITFFLVRIFLFFRVLSQNTGEKDLIALLRELAEKADKNEKSISLFANEVENFRAENATHIQKLGFVRFNPFNEMGGDHSFCVVLLDKKDTGFMLTGLHTRERTRVYVKYVKRGKSEYELSKEEVKVLQSAMKQ